MAIQINLATIVNNDESYSFEPEYDGAPKNLTDCTITVYVKASSTADDDTATTYLSGGQYVDITSEIDSEFTWTFPHGDNNAAGSFWYRIDITDANDYVSTYFRGNLTVLAS